MNEVYKRVAAWNNLRYEREFDLQLTLSLLHEEIGEFFEADNVVDEVDALCDTIFVALGAVWKLDGDTEHATQRSNVVCHVLVDLQELLPVYYLPSFLSAMAHGGNPMSMLWNIIQVSAAQLSYIGLTPSGIEQVLLAVCDANDSKSATKTASHIKANIDKGPNFVPPEKRIAEILKSQNIQ